MQFEPPLATAETNRPDAIAPQRWVEHEQNPVFAPAPELGYASFPTVLYSRERFGVTNGPFYRMWFDTLQGLHCAESADGLTWSGIRPASNGLQSAMQGKVVYSADCFEQPPFSYRIWYCVATNVPRGPLHTAVSADGVNWTNDGVVAGVYIPGHKWSQRGYGPSAVLYHPAESRTINLEQPLKNRFVLFYECFILTGKGMCEIALAVSGDGINFAIVGDGPVLACGGRDRRLWDADYATFAGMIEAEGRLHAWYSGGRDQNVDLLFSGVGYAASTDGVHWTKSPRNPILTWKQTRWRWGTSSMPQAIYDPERFAAAGETNGPRFKLFLCGSENSDFFKPAWNLGIGVLNLRD